MSHRKIIPRENHGVAILMVIAVLAALMALAAPFVFSMLQHGRSARSELNEQLARAGAEAAVDHALAQRVKTSRSDFNDPTPEITTLQDLRISMDFPGAPESFNKLGLEFQNPRGLLWSAKIEDEQGKVNLNTAPPALLGNLLASAILTQSAKKDDATLYVDDASSFNRDGGLVGINGEERPLRYGSASGKLIQLAEPLLHSHHEGALVFDGRARYICNHLVGSGTAFTPFRSVYEIKGVAGLTGKLAITPDEFAQIERHLTAQSGLDGPAWGGGQIISPGSVIGPVLGVRIEVGRGFTPGTLIRIIRDGFPGGFGRVRTVHLEKNGSAQVEFEENIGVSTVKGEGGTFVEPQLKNPVNINTASHEVLEAAFTGLALASGGGAKDTVSRQTAILLTDYLLEKRAIYGSPEDLRRALQKAVDKGILTLQQRDAIFINATEPNSARLRTSTVPFCFHSFGSYTIEGSGVVNQESGLQLARHTIRQLVSLPTPYAGRFKIEYQLGFENLIEQGLASRVVTFPVPMAKYKNRPNLSTQNYARADAGNVRLDVGECGSMNGTAGVASEWLEHCNDENDAAFRQDGYDMSKRQPFVLPGVGGGFRGVATPPTSIEMWYRPMNSGQCVFYDEGSEEERNRVMFLYDPGEGLVVRIWDSCLGSGNGAQGKRKPVEFIYPIQLTPFDWHHVAASWKTSHPGGQEIRKDALPFPNNDPTLLKFKPGGRLANDLAVDEVASISLEDADGEDFPKAGALRVGEEIIEYAQHSGNSFQQLFRGARMSAAVKHKSGEWVIPYGYVNNMTQDLTVGGATLSEDLDQASLTQTVVEFPPNVKPADALITETETTLPVADASDFPPSGFVIAGGEFIYYGSKRRAQTGWVLDKLVREQTGKTEGGGAITPKKRDIFARASVVLDSIQVSDIANYDPIGIVQIDDASNDKKVEWIFHTDTRNMNGKNYLLGEIHWVPGPPPTIYHGRPPQSAGQAPAAYVRRFRDEFGIGSAKYLGTKDSSTHSKGKPVIPVIRMAGPHCGGWWNPQLANKTDPTPTHDSPYGENGESEVTVAELGATDGELHWVKQGCLRQYPIDNGQPCPAFAVVDWGLEYYVGLETFVGRRFPANTTRYLHWPSGELPDAVGAKRNVCASRNGDGKVNGHVDELRVNTFNSFGGRVAMDLNATPVAAGDEQISIEAFDSWPNPGGGGNNLNWPAQGGLIRIDDELIFFTTAAGGSTTYYADTYPALKDKPSPMNKADRRWYNEPCLPKVTDMKQQAQLTKKGTRGTVVLTNCKRGVLGTKAADHNVGAQAMLIDAMPISYLTGPLAAAGDRFSIRDGRGFPQEGYAWINDEVLSYKQRNGNGFDGCEHFRGRYGTSAGDQENGDIVRCLPFRYWDRNPDHYNGDGIAYIQAGYSASDATWDAVKLDILGDEYLPRPAHVIPRILVRFDGRPGWEIDAVNEEGGMFEFLNRHGDGIYKLQGLQSGGIRADQIEVRVYWKYLSGAFSKAQGTDWKRTFSIERLRANYWTPLVMRRLDEIEKR